MNVNNLFHESIFVKHDFSVLRNIGAQEYLSDVIIDNLENQGIPVLGRKETSMEPLLLKYPLQKLLLLMPRE